MSPCLLAPAVSCRNGWLDNVKAESDEGQQHVFHGIVMYIVCLLVSNGTFL